MIGVFDSGIGGLSVLAEIRRLLPDVDLLYVADQARAPFGVRELADVQVISHQIADWLVSQGADCLVLACNTASAAALDSIRTAHPGLVVVGMEPAVKPAVARTDSGTVAVFATQTTFQGELFDSVVSRFATGIEVMEVACPEWVEIVEDGDVNGETAQHAVYERLRRPLEKGVDTIVLGCTHFSFLKPVIEELCDATVIDPAPAVAARASVVAPSLEGSAMTTLSTSGDTTSFAKLANGVGGVDATVIRFAP